VIIIGLDPGKTGAISILKDGELIETYRMQSIEKQIDFQDFIRFTDSIQEKFSDQDIVAYLEKVSPIRGSSASSTFNFGKAYGIKKLFASRYRFKEVKPNQWQKIAWDGITRIAKTEKGKMKTDTKAMSLVAAKRLFPKWDFRNIGVTGKPLTTYHDGEVDAALIAYYGYLDQRG